MTRFTDRVTRDLHQIADRSTPSSTAWDSIRTRIDEQTDQPTIEVIMLSPDRNDRPRRGWMLTAAAVAGLALVGGLVFATTRSDDTVPADTPVVTLPTEPAPDAEGDPDAEAVVVPAPDPTTATEVLPPATVLQPVTVIGNTYSFQDVVMTSPSGTGLVGEESWQGTTVFEGQMAGTAPGTWQTWRPKNGTRFGVGEFVFAGTIEGLGSGTLTYADQWLMVDGIRSTKGATITGGTGDFEGAYGSAEFNKLPQTGGGTGRLLVPRPPETGDGGKYSLNITVPPKGSLVSVTATGTVTTPQFLDPDGTNGFSMIQNLEGSLVGSTRGSGQGWGVPEGIGIAESSWEFTGTIDGLGTGTMTYDRIRVETAEGENWFDVVTGGTGNFEGITGTGQDGPNGSYIYLLTAPVNQ